MCLEVQEDVTAMEIAGPAAGVVSWLTCWKQMEGMEVFEPSGGDAVHEL